MKLSSPETRAGHRERFIALWLFLVALAVAFGFRVHQLDVRPMHTDETTQAIKFRDMTQGKYHYDPVEHHGPTLLYSTFPSVWKSEAGSFADLKEEDLRMVPVVYGLAILLFLPLLGNGMGWLAVAWAALFFAVSPLFVFYSRYYIMEMLLAFFSLTAVIGGWRFYVSRNTFWLGVCAISFGLMHATKETFVINVAAMFGGIVGVAIVRQLGGGSRVLNRNKPQPIMKKHWAIFFSLAVFTSVICFSQAFTQMQSVVDSVMTYANYIGGRTTDTGHVKPWSYYLQLLAYNQGGKFWLGETDGPFIWSELFLLILAFFGMIRAFFGTPSKTWQRELMMFLSIYAVLTFAVYSVLGYKTPWCILSTHLALILLAGFAAAGMIQGLMSNWPKWILAGCLMVGVGHLALQSYRTNFKDDPTGPAILRTRNTHSLASNPYAYGFTPTSLRDSIVKSLESYAAASPDGYNLRVEIAASGGSWPLPWYLRKFTSVAYLPDVEPKFGIRGVDPTADVILVEVPMVPRLPESVRGPDYNGSKDYTMRIFGMLNQQFWIQGYVKRSIVGEEMPKPPPTPEPAPQLDPEPPATEPATAADIPLQPAPTSPTPSGTPIPEVADPDAPPPPNLEIPVSPNP